MTALPASASSSRSSDAAHAHEAVLVCGVNWVGDSIMTMPALQAFRRAHPNAYITLLIKPPLTQLWKLHPVPNEILPLHSGFWGTLKTARLIRQRRYPRAFVLPHSFRSALVPFLSGVRERWGMPGHWRGAMMTRVLNPRPPQPGREHQAWEYMDLLLPGHKEQELERPLLNLPDEAAAAAKARLAALPKPCVGILPGAARGPSKRWPADHFINLGRSLVKEKHCSVVALGISREAALCRKVVEGIGEGALNLAGQTTLAEWIALLKVCDLVIANDSGGMHLAAAVGTPVVAIFGVTDPLRTGPLGRDCRIVQNSSVRNRDVERDSPEAIKSLASITPEQVFEQARELLDRATPS